MIRRRAFLRSFFFFDFCDSRPRPLLSLFFPILLILVLLQKKHGEEVLQAERELCMRLFRLLVFVFVGVARQNRKGIELAKKEKKEELRVFPQQVSKNKEERQSFLSLLLFSLFPFSPPSTSAPRPRRRRCRPCPRRRAPRVPRRPRSPSRRCRGAASSSRSPLPPPQKRKRRR
jgi:hypothetical protein